MTTPPDKFEIVFSALEEASKDDDLRPDAEYVAQQAEDMRGIDELRRLSAAIASPAPSFFTGV